MQQVTKKPWTARRIHLWLAVILAMPLLLTAVTGVVLGFRGPQVMGLGIPAQWIPGKDVDMPQQVTAYWLAPDGSQWVGTMMGLWHIKDNEPQAIPQFAGSEVVALAPIAASETPVVGLKMAVWAMQDGKWQAAQQRGRVRSLVGLPDGTAFAIIGGKGDTAESKPFTSKDGFNWQPATPVNQAVGKIPAQTDYKVPLVQLARELHTGAIFVGREGEKVWNTILGVVLSILGLSGLLMWLRTERRKAQAQAAIAQGVK